MGILDQETLDKRVRSYIKRAARKNSNAPLYPLDMVGLFRIVGGTTDAGSASGLCSGDRYKIKNDIVEGRFIDVIAYAVQQRHFAGWYLSLDGNIDNNHHGYVEKIEPVDLTGIKFLDKPII